MIRSIVRTERVDAVRFAAACYRESRRISAGRSDLRASCARLRRAFGRARGYPEFRRRVSERTLRVSPAVLHSLRELRDRPGLRVVFARNIEAPVGRGPNSRFGLGEFADAAALSFRLRWPRPDPAFYRRALRIARTEDPGVLYLDDDPDHVRAVRRLGVPSRRVRSPREAARFLRSPARAPVRSVRRPRPERLS